LSNPTFLLSGVRMDAAKRWRPRQLGCNFFEGFAG
jgi:hypothetical protein